MSQAVASNKQIDFIMSLIAERAERNNVPDAQAVREALVQQRLTKTGASAMINTLLAQPKDAPKQAAEDAPVAEAVRGNRYAGKCGTCGNKVAEMTGRIERINGRWVTFHLDGQCPTDLQTKLNEMLADLPDGYFAVPYIGGDNHTDLTFFGIRTRNNDSGDRYVVHVVGGHGDTEDVSLAWIERAIAALTATEGAPFANAMSLYGTSLGYCGACGRHLTNQQSRDLGIGPDCLAGM